MSSTDLETLMQNVLAAKKTLEEARTAAAAARRAHVAADNRANEAQATFDRARVALDAGLSR